MDILKWLRWQWDRVGAVAATVLGALFLLVGWARVSDQVYPAGQLPYLLSGGLGGLFLLGVGTTLWLSADLRDEWRELRLLREELARHRAGDDAAPIVNALDASTNGSSTASKGSAASAQSRARRSSALRA